MPEVTDKNDVMLSDGHEAHDWETFREKGLLWLVNAAVFHPRGFAFTFVYEHGELVGWEILGDGKEPWQFGVDVQQEFERVEAYLEELRQRHHITFTTKEGKK